MGCKVGKYDLCIVQGADINDITIIPKNDDGTAIILTGFTASLQIRPNVTSNVLLDSLTTENTRITIEENIDGFWEVTVKFPSSVTAKYSFKEATYNLELYHGTLVDRYLQGKVYVNRDGNR